MMTEILNCPQTGDNCNLCVSLAEEEFGDELRAAGFDEPTTQHFIGDEKLKALVSEQGGVTQLSCEQRRMTARIIGRRAGEAFVYRNNTPTDN